MTGHIPEARLSELSGEVIYKPFQAAELTQKLRALLKS